MLAGRRDGKRVHKSLGRINLETKPRSGDGRTPKSDVERRTTVQTLGLLYHRFNSC